MTFYIYPDILIRKGNDVTKAITATEGLDKMGRSKAEFIIARFLHVRFGICVYPYPGDEADLRTSCGLNIEVKKEAHTNQFMFSSWTFDNQDFDLAILVRQRKGLEYLILPWSEVDRICRKTRRPGRRTITVMPPAELEWNILEDIDGTVNL